MIRTLIVDDSPLVRSIIRDFLESDGNFMVIGEAENGRQGVDFARQYSPDLITMDIEMPLMNGLEAISEIREENINPAIVVISTHDTAKMAYDATVKGAHEFFPKDIFTSQMTELRRIEILNTLKQITEKKRSPVYNNVSQGAIIDPRKISAVVIASSTGGPKALCKLFSNLPENFPVPIILVQHNTSGFDKGFVQWLSGFTKLNVCLAQPWVIPVKRNIYAAPTDRHLLIGNMGFVLNDGEPVHNQKPAADELFRSASVRYGKSLISVVLTGMGEDGAEGTRYVKKEGGITIAQDEASSMIFGMPKAAIDTFCVDMVLPLNSIADKLVFLTQGKN